MANLGLGLNTGGTYTDAVIMDIDSDEVLCKNKSLTTHDDLSVGIDNVLRNFGPDLLKKITMVSLSSTLATNFVVEGKGRRIALIAVGSKFDGSVHVDRYISVKGGHDTYGKQTEPLDEESVREFLESVRGEVDAVAITSFLSVYNPDHEIRLKKLAESILGIPVVCGHELSSDLGFSERAVTAIMNANLLPAIRELIDSVKRVFSERGICAPLMIVKGDGSLMSEESAVERPVETIISGPAASIIGARTMTGIDDAVVIDMGGTTTDIGILRNGRPVISPDGASIAGKNTKVLAANIFTAGLGGDSRILVINRELILSDRRAMPLCIAASQWPGLEEKLKEVAAGKDRRYFEMANSTDAVQDIEFFVRLKASDGGTLSGRDKLLFDMLADGPMNLKTAAEAMGTHPMALDPTKMEDAGLIQRIGLTPTDILHAEGTYTEFNVNASRYGVEYLAAKAGTSDDIFVKAAKERVIDKLASFLIRKVVTDQIGTFEISDVGKEFMKRFITRMDSEYYGCDIRFVKPIIGIGAPARAYFPAVAKKLNAKLVLPEDFDVGNAIGAVAGHIVESVLMTIRPARHFGMEPNPRCSVQSSYGTWDFSSLDAGRKFAVSKGKEIALKRSKDNHIGDVQIFVDEHEDSCVHVNGGKEIAKIEIVVTAVGKAKFADRT